MKGRGAEYFKINIERVMYTIVYMWVSRSNLHPEVIDTLNWKMNSMTPTPTGYSRQGECRCIKENRTQKKKKFKTSRTL